MTKNPLKLSVAERISIAANQRKSQMENDRVRTWGEAADPRSLYTLPGVGTVVFRKLTPTGWPVFNLAKDPVYFGSITIQGERGAAFANWARDRGLA